MAHICQTPGCGITGKENFYLNTSGNPLKYCKTCHRLITKRNTYDRRAKAKHVRLKEVIRNRVARTLTNEMLD